MSIKDIADEDQNKMRIMLLETGGKESLAIQQQKLSCAVPTTLWKAEACEQ